MNTDSMTRGRHAAIPGARKATVSTATPTTEPAPQTARTTDPDSLAYLDFLYGFGAGPEVDLGVPKKYSHVPTATGCVFREDFERGIALCNCGDAAAEVVLEQAYYDHDGTRHTSVGIPPHSVKVLFDELR
jgi:hypothetical protein